MPRTHTHLCISKLVLYCEHRIKSPGAEGVFLGEQLAVYFRNGCWNYCVDQIRIAGMTT